MSTISRRALFSRWIAATTFGVLAMAGANSASAGFLVTYEGPGVQNANQATLCSGLGGGGSSPCTIGIENFNSRSVGTGNSFTTDYGINGTYTVSGAYKNVEIRNADQYGGADASGRYPVAFTSTPYELTLTTNLTPGINYFGYWLSALDAGNRVEFYSGTTLVFTFDPDDVIALVGDCPNTANPYCANPNNSAQDAAEPYVFLNFFDQDGTFDRIVFYEAQGYGGGYESDNHTVGFVTAISGTPVTVPEPASLMLLGLGLAGLGFSRRRR